MSTTDWPYEDETPLEAKRFRDLLVSSLRGCGFDPKFDDNENTVTSERVQDTGPPLEIKITTRLMLEWESPRGKAGPTRWRCKVTDTSVGNTPYHNDDALKRVVAAVQNAVVHVLGGHAPRERPPHDPVIGPYDEPLQGPFSGTLRDYSGFATEKEVSDLTVGDFPLGRWTFAPPGREARVGPDLFMVPDKKKPREFRGTLICAPQNSGKTTLLLRWAAAAIRSKRPSHQFIIDVKGNLRDKLSDDPDHLIYYFSTNPEDACDRINFLSGLDPASPQGSEVIREIATALLPHEGKVDRGSREDFYFRNDSVWLTALIHVIKLVERYLPHEFSDEAGGQREADLGDLYELARDDDRLYRFIHYLRICEALAAEAGQQPTHCGIDYWLQELILLIDPRRMPPRLAIPSDLFEQYDFPPEVVVALQPLVGVVFGNATIFVRAVSRALGDIPLSAADESRLRQLSLLTPEGQRELQYGYRQFTQAIVTALEPFARHGTLYPRIRSVGDGRQFSIDDLDREDKQVTMLIAARQQDQEKASTVLALAITRLQHVLLNRMTRSREKLTPILLLLDETRRIRGFKANEYITFAREAQAACVVVYQSIDQIGDDAAVTEMLENVGTQIYLGKLAGNTAQAFIKMLPPRHRTTISEQLTDATEGVRGHSLSIGRELSDYLNRAELYELPAGEYPAVVYLNDLPPRKPILVSMEVVETAERRSAGERVPPRKKPNDRQ